MNVKYKIAAMTIACLFVAHGFRWMMGMFSGGSPE